MRSEVELPELRSTENEPEAFLHKCAVNVSAPDNQNSDRWIRVNDDAVTIHWDGVGSFMVKDAREIMVDPEPGVSDRVARLFIIGASIALLLLQKQFVVFHAGVVSVNGTAVAFIGGKASGKSSMTAAMLARQHALISDDLLVFHDKPGVPEIQPGYPHMKLWPETIEALGDDPEQFPLLRPDLEKRSQPVGDRFVENPSPLQHVYILAKGPEPKISDIQPQQALLQIMPHWYGARFGPELLSRLGRDTHLRHCAALVNNTRVFRFERSPNLDALPELAELLEAHIARQKKIEAS